MKRKSVKKYISTLLAVLMVFTAMPAIAWADDGSAGMKAAEAGITAQESITPARANEAISKFTDALSKFTKDTSEMSGIFRIS